MKTIVTFLCWLLIGFSASVGLAAPTNDELISAATIGDIAKVTAALKEGANPNGQNAYGWTPLLAASAGSKFDVAVILLDAGANPNMASHTGETPLLYAVMVKNSALINLLMDKGADPTKKTTAGLSPESLAKTYGINLKKATSEPLLVPLQNTTFVILNDETLLKAKAASSELKKHGNNSILQYSYYLGDKDYGFVYRYAPIGIAIITPYSLAKYGYFKENQIFRDFPAEDKKTLLDNNGIVFVMTYSISPGGIRIGPPAPIQNVIVRKNGVVYRPINADTSLLSKWDLGGTWWAFPIGLFNANEEMEIVIIDGHDNVKPFTVKPKMLEAVK